ncbi:MAG: hypothetical protein IJ244_02635 [Bacteroidaceae bacterium]|nr:hypothetical protein [Bacteroidaceae bacterium]
MDHQNPAIDQQPEINITVPASRQLHRRELRKPAQFSFDELYISPFRQKRQYDNEGQWKYVDFPRDLQPTGIHVMDDLLQYLMQGNSSLERFATEQGLTVAEVSALVFVLTGIRCRRFQQLYQVRLIDDLLRFTDLEYEEVAQRAGIGTRFNLFRTIQREHQMSASRRRAYLRQNNDEGRFLL